MSRFSVAPLDKMALIISIGVGLLLLTVSGIAFFVPGESGEKTTVYTTILPVIILGIAYGLKPSAYVISNGKLLVKRPAWSDAEFNLSDISSVQKIEKVPNKGLVRTMGSGGLFGYYGYFSNSDFGSMRWYLTTRRDVLMLSVKSEKVFFSPKDYDAFLSELQTKIQR